MSPEALMRAADALTGVHPGMTAEQVRAAQDVPVSHLKARYLIDTYKGTRDSRVRGKTWEAMYTLAGKNSEVIPLIKQAFPNRVFAPARAGRPGRSTRAL